MPIGSSSIVPFVTAELIALQPENVLDLGCGYGWAGAAVRQWLDLGARPWRTRVVGVEVFAEYRSAQWDVYDSVHIADLRDWLPQCQEAWAAILLLDVLEHLPRPDGEAAIAAARRLLAPGGRLYVATPAVWHPQGAAHGNEAERHLELWTAEELRRIGGGLLWDGSPDRWGGAMLLATFAGAE